MPIVTPLDELEAIYGLPGETAAWRDGRDEPDLGRITWQGRLIFSIPVLARV
jgi:hypothetical protein